jgi:hypothetical protein
LWHKPKLNTIRPASVRLSIGSGNSTLRERRTERGKQKHRDGLPTGPVRSKPNERPLNVNGNSKHNGRQSRGNASRKPSVSLLKRRDNSNWKHNVWWLNVNGNSKRNARRSRGNGSKKRSASPPKRHGNSNWRRNA